MSPRSKCTRWTPEIASRTWKDKFNIGYCNITTCCRQVCPESIQITENAIIPLKERVVDEFFDPLKKLLHIL